MGSNKRFIFRLRYLVIGVVMMAFISTIASSLWGVYQISKNILIENTLETNRVYAQKLATTANTYLEETFKTLQFSALYISENYGNEALLQQEVERLRYQTDVFNSVAITDGEGVVLAISPPTLELKGVQLSSEQTGEALEKNSRIYPSLMKELRDGSLFSFLTPFLMLRASISDLLAEPFISNMTIYSTNCWESIFIMTVRMYM